MASAGFMNLRWQPCDDMPEFGRLQTEFQLPEVLFDQFVNGRSGYRAQYFLSPEEGVLFNHDLMHGLDAVIQTAVALQRSAMGASTVDGKSQPNEQATKAGRG